jgi:Fe-S cluster assembly protein SufD
MSGSMTRSEDKPLAVEGVLPDGILSQETSEGLTLTVPERGMFEPLILLRVLEKAKLRVLAGAGSRVRLILDYEYAAGLEADFELEAGACMDVFHLDFQERDGKLPSNSVYALKKHASLNVWTFASGGTADISHAVKFLEPHGFASVRGLSLLGGSSEVTHRVLADHRTGHCVSRQFYKSVVAGHAKSSFESMVAVSHGADKSDSRQLNKNLLLSKEAAASSRPELKIHADDVSCAHGSATGELRQEELFYLRSRGIEENAARFMMIEGFANEILEEVPETPLKGELKEFVEFRIQELAKA